MDIVRDGESRVADDGSLLLSPGDGGGGGDEGSGGSGSGHLLSTRSVNGQILPPLPASVGAVNFTWDANTMVSCQTQYSWHFLHNCQCQTAHTCNYIYFKYIYIQRMGFHSLVVCFYSDVHISVVASPKDLL